MQCLTCIVAVALLVIGAVTERWGLVLLALVLFVWSRMARAGVSVGFTVGTPGESEMDNVPNAPRDLGDTKVRASSGASAGPSTGGGRNAHCA